MTNSRMAVNYLDQAQFRLQVVSTALKEHQFAVAVRQPQEVVELSLKGILRLYGIEPPKWHEVSKVIQDNLRIFPEWFQEIVPEIARISKTLASKREVSFYGDEESGIPAVELFSLVDAERALTDARYVVDAMQRLLSEFLKNKKQ